MKPVASSVINIEAHKGFGILVLVQIVLCNRKSYTALDPIYCKSSLYTSYLFVVHDIGKGIGMCMCNV